MKDLKTTAITWKKKGNEAYKNSAYERALELFDLTISDRRYLKRLRELTRLRETFVDYMGFDNQYGSSEDQWMNYFDSFNYAARSNIR